MTENKIVKRLREESNYVLSFIRFFLFIYGAIILFYSVVLLGTLLFRNGIAADLNGSSAGTLSKLLAGLLSALVDWNPVNAHGKLQILRLMFMLISTIFTNAFMFYVFNNLLHIFKNMERGETPFTLENASCWKKVSRIFAALAMILFLISFILPGFISSILFPLMASCFFHALGLIFEYGSQLQQESDETL